jgi:hypothetical protein
VSQEQKPVQQDSPSTFEEVGNHEQLSLMKELWLMIKENKAWWMIPIVLTLSLVGLLIVLGSTGAAPFIYTLF